MIITQKSDGYAWKSIFASGFYGKTGGHWKSLGLRFVWVDSSSYGYEIFKCMTFFNLFSIGHVNTLNGKLKSTIKDGFHFSLFKLRIAAEFDYINPAEYPGCFVNNKKKERRFL